MGMYSLRWFHSAEKYNVCENISGPLVNGVGPNGEECHLSFWDSYVFPILPYIIWQVLYLVKVRRKGDIEKEGVKDENFEEKQKNKKVGNGDLKCLNLLDIFLFFPALG
jgi:hypothetical protein